ncbi:MAG TPA: ATP synthase F0 subunit B [Polyangiaceae bacterium]|nr:ATP synthase F0 subunit B [Polyangiaceae bacterium]
MKALRRWLVSSSLAGALALAGAAAVAAQDHGQNAAEHAVDHAVQHAAAESEDTAPPHGHGAEHEQHHVPTFDDVNWFYGILAARDGVEPSLLFRPTGMPVPVASLFLNAFIVYYLLYRLLGKTIADGLRKRKETILRGMQEAAKMKAEAEAELAQYEERLAKIEQEIERIRREMRQTAETERNRVLTEAKERRERMERDARELVEQELAAVRQALFSETVQSAMRSAETALKERVTSADQQRLADEYIAGLRQTRVSLRPSTRGRA